MYEGIKMSRSVSKKQAFCRHRFHTWYALKEYCYIAKMVKALALRQERLTTVGRVTITEGKEKKHRVKILCVYAISIWIFFCQQKLKGELSFPSSPCYKIPILMLLVSDAVSFLQNPTAIPFWQFYPQPRIQPQSFNQLSRSHSYSHSQTQCLLPLLQHPFQNPIRSTGKNN